MSILIATLIGVLMGMIIMFLIVRIKIGNIEKMIESLNQFNPKEKRMSLNNIRIVPELVILLKQNKKIAAVSRVRELYGWGLADAKQYVDDLENEMKSDKNLSIYFDLKPELIMLIKQEKKIVAIKKVRELYGWGLADAKQYVDDLENEINLDKRHAMNDDLEQELIKLIKQNKEIAAIKKVKELYGWNLVDAKKYVDDLDDQTN